MLRIIFLLIFSVSVAYAQKADSTGYAIKIQIKGIRDSTCYLAHYFGAGQFLVKDTARADTSGYLLFEGKQKLPQGLYFIALPFKSRFELVVSENQYFSAVTDRAGLIKLAQFTNSPDNRLYYDYLVQQEKAVSDIEIMRMTLRDENLLRVKINGVDQNLNRFRTALAKGSPDLLASKYLKAAGEVPFGAAPTLPNGGIDTAAIRKNYYEHFFDNIDFADERTLHSPFLEQRIERYMKRLTYPSVDSLIAAADRLVKLAEANKDVMRFCVWKIINIYENPKMIGVDGVFVHMAESYYLTGKVPADTSTLKSLADRIKTIKPLMLGKPFPELSMSDPAGKLRRVQDVKANLTIVVFYDPMCSRCRESMPKIAEWYKKYKAEGIEVYAASVEHYKAAWNTFLDEFKIRNLWINVWDASAKIDFKKHFDVYGAPVIYVLNPEKRIFTKRIEVNQLEDLMQLLKYNQQTAANK